MLADFQRKSPRNDVDFENPVSQGFRTPVISPPRGQIPGGGGESLRHRYIWKWFLLLLLLQLLFSYVQGKRV